MKRKNIPRLRQCIFRNVTASLKIAKNCLQYLPEATNQIVRFLAANRGTRIFLVSDIHVT